MRRLVPCTLAGLIVGMTGNLARAETAVAVLGVEAVDAPAELAAKLTEALRGQVRKSPGFRLLAGKSLEEIKLVFGCVDENPDCMARVGRSLGSAKLVWGTLKKSGAGFNLTIKYLDVASAAVEKFVSENVEAAELGGGGTQAVVERLTGSFLPGSRGALRIGSNVEGAPVEVAGKVVGATRPGGLVVRNLRAGQVEVRVSKAGYRSWSQSVAISAGETAYVDAQLEAAPEQVLRPVTQPALQPAGRAVLVEDGLEGGLLDQRGGHPGAGRRHRGGRASRCCVEQDDKDAAIRAYPAEAPRRSDFVKPGTDVCALAGQPEVSGYGAGIRSACDSGQKWADLVNFVFIP